jgi:hypothetical protein
MTSLPLSLSLSLAPALALALSRVMSGGASSSNVPPLPPSLAPVGVPPPSPRSRVQESSLSWDELAEAEAWLAGTHRSGRTGAGRIARRHTAYLANARPNKKHRLEEARDVRRREGNAEAVGKAAVIGRPSLSSAFAGPPQPKGFSAPTAKAAGPPLPPPPPPAEDPPASATPPPPDPADGSALAGMPERGAMSQIDVKRTIEILRTGGLPAEERARLSDMCLWHKVTVIKARLARARGAVQGADFARELLAGSAAQPGAPTASMNMCMH